MSIDYRRYDHSEDVRRIVIVAAKNDTFVTPDDAHAAWARVSEMSAAGWLFLPEDDDDLWHEVHGQIVDLSQSCKHPEYDRIGG